MICRILYQNALKSQYFKDFDFAETVYPEKDYSVMDIAELEAAYEIEN